MNLVINLKSFVPVAVALFAVCASPFVQATEDCTLSGACQRVYGVGHGIVDEDNSRPLLERQLEAIRAARVDALRALAEQAKGVRVESVSQGEANRLLADNAFVRVDTQLQGVRYLKVEPLQSGLYQAIVEMDVYR
jgi:hypothetical protein